MPIQIIPKPEEKKPILPEILLYFALVLLISAGASYFVLDNLLKKTEQNIQNIDQEIAQLAASPEGKLETKILDYQKKINNFSKLINDYRYSSQAFPFIEGLAHTKVLFFDFSADIAENTITISGAADSFQTVAQQLMIFREETLITSTKLSGVSLGDGGEIPFTFELTLNPGVFTEKTTEEEQTNE